LDEELRRHRRRKNIALATLLFSFVALVYVVSLVRMGGG